MSRYMAHLVLKVAHALLKPAGLVADFLGRAERVVVRVACVSSERAADRRHQAGMEAGALGGVRDADAPEPGS